MFPHIYTINDLLPHIKHKEEFTIGEKDDYIFIDYQYNTPQTFETPHDLECRGIKFDKNTKETIARPLHKFFNLGEKQQYADIDIDKPHFVFPKLDGSMVHGCIIGNNVRLMTRRGITDTSLLAESKFLSRVERLCYTMDLHDYTCIFEFTSPENRVVIPYKEDRITLLAIRHNYTGSYVNHMTLSSIAESHNIYYVSNIFNVKNLREFHTSVKELKGQEGVVVKFYDGHMLKIKADEYVIQHRAKDDLNTKAKVVNVILSDSYDDFIGCLSDDDRKEVQAFRQAVDQEIWLHCNSISTYVPFLGTKEMYHYINENKKISGEHRKLYAEQIKKIKPQYLVPAAFKILDGTTPYQAVQSLFLKHPELVTTRWRGM